VIAVDFNANLIDIQNISIYFGSKNRLKLSRVNCRFFIPPSSPIVKENNKIKAKGTTINMIIHNIYGYEVCFIFILPSPSSLYEYFLVIPSSLLQSLQVSLSYYEPSILILHL